MSLSSILALSPPNSYTDVLTAHRTLYATLISTNTYQPFVYPYRAFGLHLFGAYLLIPPIDSRKSPALAIVVDWARYPVFVIASWLCIRAMLECRSPSVSVGYGIGLLNSVGILWMAALIIFGDARSEARRIERVRGDEMDVGVNGEARGSNADTNGDLGGGLRRRATHDSPTERKQNGQDIQAVGAMRFRWQRLPHQFWHRVDWVTDLVFNARGIRWSHQISGLPYPDVSSLSAFADPIFRRSSTLSAASPRPLRSRTYPTRSALILANLRSFIINLVALDILKYLVLQDPYYWGIPDPGPSPFQLPKNFRIVLSVASTYCFLWSFFLLSPLVYCGLAGERYLGDHAWPWLYPPFNGSPTLIGRKGLEGVWGGWWHQVFRYGFEQAGEFVGRSLGWEKRTVKGSVLRVAVAFICSGYLHACSSYTTLPETKPINPFLFFALQPAGIIFQRAVAGWMRRIGLRDKIPSIIRQTCNFLFVIAWFRLTGPLIADDFAKSAVWLDEPMPISVVRGLRGEGWWVWGGQWARWHKADRWWRSGIAF